MRYEVYRCDGCGCLIEEAWPHVKHDGKDYCSDCAYRLGLADNEHFHGYWIARETAIGLEITPRITMQTAYKTGCF